MFIGPACCIQTVWWTTSVSKAHVCSGHTYLLAWLSGTILFGKYAVWFVVMVSWFSWLTLKWWLVGWISPVVYKSVWGCTDEEKWWREKRALNLEAVGKASTERGIKRSSQAYLNLTISANIKEDEKCYIKSFYFSTLHLKFELNLFVKIPRLFKPWPTIKLQLAATVAVVEVIAPGF